MDNKTLKNIIAEKLRGGIIKYDEPMSKHTSIRIGGPCDAMVFPENIEDITNILKMCKNEKIPLIVVGKGSNLLVRDGGIRGIVLKISENFCYTSVKNNILTAQTGALMSNIAYKAMSNSLSGLEFASGIPGTVGGGVYMNAGAYGNEIKDVLEHSVCLDREGDIFKLDNAGHRFGYRNSIFSSKDYIILESTFKLKPDNREKIKQKMAKLNQSRREKQPLTLPNAGSTFKRPEGYFAGALIEESGLMGYRVGGVSVSKKHAGFIVNDKKGNAEDMEKLIQHIRQTVYNKTGVELIPEIKIIGEKVE